ncbi:MAG: CBS domain-containing protein [Candidatus Hydrothermarchaeaceae archaeon]
MRDSIKIISVFGIPIELHISFVILMGVLALASLAFDSGGFLLYILLLFFFVLLHELSHSLVARKYDVTIDRIVLLPFGGVSAMEKIPEDPSTELRIAIAGPMINFAVAVVAALPLLLSPSGMERFYQSFFSLALPRDFLGLAAVVLKVNILLGAFNLLVPALPMDGGRIFRAILAFRMGFADATELSSGVAKIIAVMMFFFGLFFNPWLMLIAVFIYIGAVQESRITVASSLLRGMKVRDIMSIEVVTLGPNITLDDVSDLIIHHKHMGYPVMEGGDMIGILTFTDLANVTKSKWPVTRVGEVMTRDIIICRPNEDAMDALMRMSARAVGRLPVIEEGKLVGIISKTDVLRIIEIMRLTKPA